MYVFRQEGGVNGRVTGKLHNWKGYGSVQCIIKVLSWCLSGGETEETLSCDTMYSGTLDCECFARRAKIFNTF
jgi:hypothetical protein